MCAKFRNLRFTRGETAPDKPQSNFNARHSTVVRGNYRLLVFLLERRLH